MNALHLHSECSDECIKTKVDEKAESIKTHPTLFEDPSDALFF